MVFALCPGEGRLWGVSIMYILTLIEIDFLIGFMLWALSSPKATRNVKRVVTKALLAALLTLRVAFGDDKAHSTKLVELSK